jgi:hypothetical protein
LVQLFVIERFDTAEYLNVDPIARDGTHPVSLSISLGLGSPARRRGTCDGQRHFMVV